MQNTHPANPVRLYSRLTAERPSRPGILTGMRVLGVALLVLTVVACPALARAEAMLGSGFADAYVAFAPLEALYRSFADHLFAGTPIAVPAGLGSCCDGYLPALQTLQEQLVVQTTSEIGEVLGALVRLRADAEATCAEFQPDLVTLGESTDVSAELEDRLAAKRLFARIGDLNERFEDALDAALVGVGEGEPRWVMSVTFAVRTLLVSSGWVRVAPDVATIFYGRDAASPSFDVSDAVREAMASIASVAGMDLNEEQMANVRESAEAIYEDFISG
jgi:hypothetical protein